MKRPDFWPRRPTVVAGVCRHNALWAAGVIVELWIV
jgi:hypothetical protein